MQFCGVCSDICVISNIIATQTVNPEIKISFLFNLCAGTSVEKHEATIDILTSLGVDIKGVFSITSPYYEVMYNNRQCEECAHEKDTSIECKFCIDKNEFVRLSCLNCAMYNQSCEKCEGYSEFILK